ncbi:helix-turn-helix domain-containing protein [Streptomyces sp. NPDC054863]
MASSENKESAGPTARYVAKVAKKMREKRGWSQVQLGKELGFTGAAVSAMETLAQPVSDEMLVALERVMGDGTGVFEEAREAVRMERYPVYFRDYALLEEKARSLMTYATMAIPGLFQTEAYARALIGMDFPPLAAARVTELADARMARTGIFDREPQPLIEAVIDEAVLRRPFGTHEIMHGQHLHLVELGRRRNVTLQVMPLTRGLSGEHAGGRGELQLIETADLLRFAYLELQGESMLIGDPAKVSLLTQRYAKIRAQALSSEDSLGLIERLAGEYR